MTRFVPALAAFPFINCEALPPIEIKLTTQNNAVLSKKADTFNMWYTSMKMISCLFAAYWAHQ